MGQPCPAPSWLILVALVLWLLPPAAPGVLAQATTALTTEDERNLQEIRDFVKATAQRYGMLAPLEVSVASWVGSPSLPQFANVSAVYTRGAVYLRRQLLTSPTRDLVIAQVLAAEILRSPSKATSLAEREREQSQLRLDANAHAVGILVQVKGMPEEDALERMYANLIAIRRATAGRPLGTGDVSACDQITDLIGRFPRHRERSTGRECAPG